MRTFLLLALSLSVVPGCRRTTSGPPGEAIPGAAVDESSASSPVVTGIAAGNYDACATMSDGSV